MDGHITLKGIITRLDVLDAFVEQAQKNKAVTAGDLEPSSMFSLCASFI